MNAPALTLNNVTLEYPDGGSTLKALDNVSLSVDRGEFMALTGPSGSGKSSLLAVAATLQPATAGTVTISGHDAGHLSSAETARIRRDEVGIIFQQPNLLPSLTATEQLLLTAHLRGAGSLGGRRRALWTAARERAATLLEAVGLADQAGKKPHQLSGGQRQRVNIARALMNAPTLLLVDEPTAALDAERSEQVVELLAQVTRDFNTATIMVTHDLEFVSLCSREEHMVDGRLGALATA